jgi:hypothetical protein
LWWLHATFAVKEKVPHKICGQVHDLKNIKFHISIYSGSSVIDINPKAKYIFNVVATMFF